MSLGEDERKAIVDYRIEKANIALSEAKQVKEIALWNISANRLYYCLYYVFSALFISKGLAPHTHKGVIVLVHQKLVRTGLISEDEGALVSRMYNLRQEGDYEDFEDVTESEINQKLPQVEALKDKILSFIRNNGLAI